MGKAPTSPADLPRAVLEAELAEVELAPGSVVVADLHLEAGDPGGADAFVALCARLAGHPRLIVLGDLFDAWVGPAHLRAGGAQRVVGALRELGRGGTAVEVVHGNRDFLLEGSFAAASGARVHPHGIVGRVAAGGERILFMHGDELCTLDRSYQRLRRFLRSRAVVGLAKRLPLPLALVVARRLRRASKRALDLKPSAQKRMQVPAAQRVMERHGARILVCGHAHQARDQRLPDGRRWLVVDAFGGGLDALWVGAGGRVRLAHSAQLPSAPLEPRPET